MEHLRHDLHRHALSLIQIGQGHQDHPLRAADAEGFCPEITNLLEMHVDGGDLPGELPGDVVILPAELI
jgi:hypothetical protein